MASPSKQASAPTQRRPRVRKSIAHVPSSDTAQDQENAAQQRVKSSNPTAAPNVKSKKSRSKSLGPGLDPLHEITGNRRKSVSSFVPKSILKPSIPLSPIREIPARKASPKRNGDSPRKRAITPNGESGPDTSSRKASPGAFSQEHLNDEKEQENSQHNNAEDAEAAKRRQRKEEIQKQREARRKSMAGRRVSFAPEATLHTWDTEVLQDSTTSTGSADSTRRASSFSQTHNSNNERPQTPPENLVEDATKSLPEHQRDAHKKRRRRSSGITPMNVNDSQTLSSSPFSEQTVLVERLDSMGDVADTIADNDTIQSFEETAKEDEDEDLDASLEDAARRAGTKTLDIDENGDVSMELASDEVTAAFKPWVKQSMGAGSPHPTRNTAKLSQENINPFAASHVTENGSPTPSNHTEDDMSMDLSMDITQAMGQILHADQRFVENQPGERYPKRRPNVRRRRSSVIVSELGEGTMELTNAIGSVEGKIEKEGPDLNQVDENEELSMELTSVFGELKETHSKENSQSKQQGEKLGQHEPNVTAVEDVDMEMTEAVGFIESQYLDSHNSSQPPQGEFAISNEVIESASSWLRGKAQPKQRPSIGASTSGSPGVDPFARRDRLRRSGNGTAVTTPQKKLVIPEKVTQQQSKIKPSTPTKTPPSASVEMRKTTPKKLFQKEIEANRSPENRNPTLFKESQPGEQQTPQILLAPKNGDSQPPATSIEGKLHSGSPQIAAIVDRRTSIANNADVFAPQGISRGVSFDNPKVMEAEVSKEREEDRRRESGQFIMEQEADGDLDEENATQSLRDLMQSMTPRKSKSKSRKSLAVGSAKGLLGKRPAELDESEDEASPNTFGKSSSPVKKVRLQGPLSAGETLRSSNSDIRPLSNTTGNARPQTPNNALSPGEKPASTPKSQGRFKNTEFLASALTPVPMMGQTAPADTERSIKEASDDKIGLQDFLILTNIRFMELTTTRRRPTAAPQSLKDNQSPAGLDESDTLERFEESVVAGACTIPMLELFQHSCRELKNYIAEGRRVVREIEAETMEENPPIFREYVAAKPAERALLDKQFRNMKTNARLLTKAIWYQWRMRLLEGLQQSLKETTQGLNQDEEVLRKQHVTLEGSLNQAQQQRKRLEQEHAALRARASELAGCEPGDLEAARQRLSTVSQEIESQSHTLEQSLEASRDIEQAIAAAREAKNEAQASTKEAQRQREDYRLWSVAEVKAAQSRVDDIAKSSGWRVKAANGSKLTLEYQGELLLSFDTLAFLPASEKTQSAKTSPGLVLAYSPAKWRKGGETQASNEPSTTHHFFLQLLRAHLHSLDPQAAHATSLLKVVEAGWRLACCVSGQIKQLNRRVGITHVSIASNEKLVVETNFLLPTSQSKVNVVFRIAAAAVSSDVHGGVSVAASCAYGKPFDESGMRKVLRKKAGETLSDMRWADAVETLREWLQRR